MSTGIALFGKRSVHAASALPVFTACLLGMGPAWAQDFGSRLTTDVPARFRVADTAFLPSVTDTASLPSADTASLPSVDSTMAFADPNAGTPASSAGATHSDPSAPCLFCRDYWGLLKGDVKHVFTSPVRWDGQTWRSVGWKALLVAGMIAWADEPTADYIDDHKSSTTDRIADRFEPFGREYAALIIGGYLLAGNLTHKPKAKKVAVDGFTSTLIAAGLITPALEKITGRSRPRTDQGAHDFNPFTGGNSFPSDHVTAAFSVAATVAQNYDAVWIKGLSYGLATMVAYARMEKDGHFLSDVTAGAMIGVGVARSVHDFNNEGGNGEGTRRADIAVRPFGDPRAPGTSGVALSVEFPLR
jgi:membrane-associated phospholipid phosphatase